MVKLLRMSLLAIAVIIAAGLLAVPVSAAPLQEFYTCPNTNIRVSPRLVVGLARRVNSTDVQALAWLCSGRNPQEIFFASRVSRRTGVSVDQVLTMRDQGRSWDQILTSFDLRDRDVWNGYPIFFKPSQNPFKNFNDLPVNRRGRIILNQNGRVFLDQNGRIVLNRNGRIVLNRNGRVVQVVRNAGNLRFIEGRWWMFNPRTGFWVMVR